MPKVGVGGDESIATSRKPAWVLGSFPRGEAWLGGESVVHHSQREVKAPPGENHRERGLGAQLRSFKNKILQLEA